MLEKIHRVAIVQGEKAGQAIPFRIDTAWNTSRFGLIGNNAFKKAGKKTGIMVISFSFN
ncbi:hypothetical protein [Xenorhabdus szentirmaii]|uniref:Uncharacterized protein n=1 Tax=Xenorhabdus szentirmaii DSM 16338 TaxID=1427518 RepID=W1ITZ7_9GAMM|nr:MULTISPECIES: hypothetical protein [Xenorhabdus]MBD2805338.1 hypothetical protein [Xenorhabdus sp. ZM]MBD2819363.1 hypothetical protein [Xenorhabdus sp. 42]MBD2823780.1 hypothetical protein [Xenorhabdus sp. 5]CDL81947.1 hypothetical protein XSR1_170067 [Xenorhabdus szentirmaii DSM 16338]